MTDTPNPPQEPTPPTGTPTPASSSLVDPADAEKNKVVALLAYLPPLLFLVPLLTAKDSPFAKFHANQGLNLNIAAFAGAIVFGCGSFILSWILGHIPVVNICASCVTCVLPLVFIAAVAALAIMGILNAVNGQMKPLPVIGGFTLIK